MLTGFEWTKNAGQVLAVGILGPVAGYAGTMLKGWIEQNNLGAKRKGLCEEADRLIKFHATLETATVPSLQVKSARDSIARELDNVLDQLSRAIIEPPGTPGHPRSHKIIAVEKWLLLYRPRGFFSWVLHSLFFMMVSLWCLFFYVGFINDVRTHASGIGVGVIVLLIFLLPIFLCNYAARLMDDRTHRRPRPAPIGLPS